MEISERLKMCRAQTGYTQADIAEKMHVSRKTISGWETGRNYPDINSVVKLSEIYQVSLDVLMKDEHLLDYFNEKRAANLRSERIFFLTYYFNVGLFVLGCFDLIRPWGFHSAVIPIALLTNLIVFFSHYEGWKRFRSKLYTIKLLTVLAVVFIGTSMISLTDSEVIHDFSTKSAYFSAGMVGARITLTLLVSVSLIVILFFRNTRK